MATITIQAKNCCKFYQTSWVAANELHSRETACMCRLYLISYKIESV